MTKRLDKIAPALKRLAGDRHDPVIMGKEPLPPAKAAPDVERKADVMRPARRVAGGQGHQVGMQIAHVVKRRPRVRGIGKGRVVMRPPVRGGAVQHRACQLRDRTSRRCRRSGSGEMLGRMERAERRRERHAARQDAPLLVLGPGGRVTRSAACRPRTPSRRAPHPSKAVRPALRQPVPGGSRPRRPPHRSGRE